MSDPCEGQMQTVANLQASLSVLLADAAILSAQLNQKQLEIQSTQSMLTSAQMALWACRQANP